MIISLSQLSTDCLHANSIILVDPIREIYSPRN